MSKRGVGDEVEHERAMAGRAGFDLGPLFDTAVDRAPAVPPMATHDDYQTSRDAADRVAVRAGSLREHVLQAVRSRPGITDPELELLPQFKACAASSVRKRRSELLKMGHVRACGRRDGATCWESK